MFKPGDLVFFKKAQKSSKKNSPAIQFSGMGFGMVMGEVPPFQKDPPKEHLMRIMGSSGFISFDDVGEFLGDEVGASVVKKFEDKYYGKVVELKKGDKVSVNGKEVGESASGETMEVNPQIEIPKELIPPTPRLIGIDGKPIQK